MHTYVHRSVFLVLPVLALVPAPVFAEPPELNYFFPAGAERGTTIEITADGSFKSWPVKIWTNRPDVQFECAKERGKFKVTAAREALPGVCRVRVYNDEGASALRPFIIGSLEHELETEPNNEPRKSQFLKTNPVVVNGRLARRGDVDVFALVLQKGQTLVASMEAHQTLKSPMDGVLQILSQKGFVLAQNDDWRGLDAQIVFPVPDDGKYYVRTFAFPATPTSSIRFAGDDDYIYQLTLTTEGFANHAFPLAVSDKTAKVGLIGWTIPPAANEVPIAVKEGADTATVFHPNVANPVHVRLESHPALVEEDANKPGKLQTIPIPSTVSGHISPAGETDAYQFQASNGQKLQAIIEASTLLSPLDPVLILKDKNGKIIEREQSRTIGQDPVLTVSAGSPGPYSIEVKDLHDRGGLTYFYRLRLVPLRGDFALRVAKDRFVVTSKKPLEIPVTIERRNGFKKEIKISAEGLPKGLVAGSVTATAKNKTVKLIVKGTGESASGEFRIVGRVDDSAGQVRTARGTVAELDTSTDHLWITFQKKK